MSPARFMLGLYIVLIGSGSPATWAQRSSPFEEFYFRRAGAPDSSSDVVLRASKNSQKVGFIALYNFLNRNDAYNKRRAASFFWWEFSQEIQPEFSSLRQLG